MKIHQNSKKSKKILTIVILAIILLSGYTVYAHTYSVWPFRTTAENTPPQNNSPATPSNNVPNTDPSTTPGDSSTLVTPPITNPPKVGDPYPIENEHYKIVQNSSTSYSVTLYPIVNNPAYSNYNDQLKAYKSEALAYLTQRYGNVNNLTIEWSPSDASGL